MAKARGKKLPERSLLLKYGLPAAIIPGIIVAAAMGFNYEKLIKTNPKNNSAIFATNVPVKAVDDGDTVQLEQGLPVRMTEIDAPDKGEPFYNESRDYLVKLLGDKKVRVEYVQRQNDTYGRVRGYVFTDCDYPAQKYCQDGEINANVAMIGEGLAKVSPTDTWVKPKPDYLPELQAAEKQAKDKKLGIWQSP